MQDEVKYLCDGRYAVKRFNICSTDSWVHSAWLRLDGEEVFGNSTFSAFTTIDGNYYGRIGSDPVNATIEYAGHTLDRSRRVMEAVREREGFAYALIEVAFPGVHGVKKNGEVLTREKM